MASAKDVKAETIGPTETAFEAFLKGLEGKNAAEIEASWPKYAALLKGWINKAEQPFLRIISSIEGFRRGGIAHAVGDVLHDLTRLHPNQVEEILNEPVLVADLVTVPQTPASVETLPDQAEGKNA